jgi:NDP-sugar pyrophosphorylase family protein
MPLATGVTLKVAILVGGKGKRLGRLTAATPKPMLPVHGKPFLETLIGHLRRSGFKDLILLCGYRADRIRNYFGDGSAFGVRIRYNIEKRPMGTAGAVKSASRLLESGKSFLLMNGDTFFQNDFRGLVRFHNRKRADLTMAVARAPRKSASARRFGSLVLDRSGRVLGFSEKGSAGRPAFLNAGLYALHPRVLRMIPRGKPCSLEHQVFPRLAGKQFFAWPVKGRFLDIGTPASYRDAPGRIRRTETTR